MSKNDNQRHNRMPNEDIFDFKEWIFKFLSYWPLLTILVFSSLIIAWLYLRYSIPIYTTSASILIKDEKEGLGSSNMFEALDLFGGKKIVDNEIEVIQSKSLARQVVENLHLYAPIDVDGRITEQSAYLSCPVRISVLVPDSIRPTDKIFFEYDSLTEKVIIDQKGYDLNKWNNTPYGVLKFYKNKYYNGRLSEMPYYFKLLTVKRATNSIISRITVQSSGKSSTVIDLSINDEIPKRGEDILNELINVYNNAAIEDKNILASNTLQFVEERLRYVVAELDSVEDALQRFKTSNQITDVSTEGQIFLETVSLNDQKIGDINIQLAVLDQIEKYVKQKEGKGSIVPASLGINNPILTTLLEALNQAEIEYDRVKKLVPENHPNAIALSDKIAKLRPDILDNLYNQRKNLVASRQELISSNNRYSSFLRSIPKKERALLDISRQQAIKNNIYTFLLQKREEAAITYASTVADSRIIDRAETIENPISPKRKLIYLIAILGAVGATVSIVALRDFFSYTIQSREEIEKLTSLPILGEINFDKNGHQLIPMNERGNFIAEQFRHIRTSLGYLGINKSNKRILVTSSISGEGKSFFTSNLGLSLSIANKRVVLLEMDLRKPKLMESFGLKRRAGISDFVIGEKSLEEVITHTSFSNLDIICSGPIPPNPAELLMNEKISNMLNSLEESYDYIIMDLPPIGPVTDAFIVSSLANTAIYLVRYDYSPKKMIRKIDELSKIHNFPNTSIVFNGVEEKKWNKYTNGYYNSEGYGYLDRKK